MFIICDLCYFLLYSRAPLLPLTLTASNVLRTL